MLGFARPIHFGALCVLLFVNATWLSVVDAQVGKELKTNDAIAVDQLGYQFVSRKVAVLAEPITGVDARTFKPGGGRFEIRSAVDDSAACIGMMVAWRGKR